MCPLPTSCCWSLVFLPDCRTLLLPSFSPERRFQHCNLEIHLPQLNLWPLWNADLCEMSSSPPTRFQAILCYLCLKSLARKKKFFLASSPFYTNISRCWDTGYSSCFLSHFKVYWLCRRIKLHSRPLELKAICLPFDQALIFFCQI